MTLGGGSPAPQRVASVLSVPEWYSVYYYYYYYICWIADRCLLYVRQESQGHSFPVHSGTERTNTTTNDLICVFCVKQDVCQARRPERGGTSLRSGKRGGD